MLCAGCESPFEPLDDQAQRVVVHAVLDFGADTQNVMLEYTREVDGVVGIVNATVTVTFPNGQVVAATRRPGVPVRSNKPQRYMFLMSEQSLGFERGAKYVLTVGVPGFPADAERSSAARLPRSRRSSPIRRWC